jgi:hypothetical protein
MKSKACAIIAFFTRVLSFSQQIGNGFATQITDFSVPLSGTYDGYNAIGSNPDTGSMAGWQHLFVVRHPNGNNYQLQISSSMTQNDKLYFRKLAVGSSIAVNPEWFEIATRGVNNFTGNQTISGNLSLGSSSNSNSKVEIIGEGVTTSLTNINNTLTQRINTANPVISIGFGYLNSDMPFIQSFNNVSVSSNSLNLNPFGGNVGIGTANPTSKLTVAGNINSLEVKVTVDAGADFVFDNTYNLPSLDSVH